MEALQSVHVEETTVDLSIRVSGSPEKVATALRRVLETMFNSAMARETVGTVSAQVRGQTSPKSDEGSFAPMAKRTGAKPPLTEPELESLWDQLSDGAQRALKEISTQAAQPGGYPKMELYRKLFPEADVPDRQVSGNLSSIGRRMSSMGLDHKALPYDASGDGFVMLPEVVKIIQRSHLRRP